MKVPGDEKRESVVMKVSGWVWIIPMADKKKNRGSMWLWNPPKNITEIEVERMSEQGKNSFSWQRGK